MSIGTIGHNLCSTALTTSNHTERSMTRPLSFVAAFALSSFAASSVAEAGTNTFPDEEVVQCVKSVAGVGYSATVEWYEPGTYSGGRVNLGNIVKSETITVGQSSCYTSHTRMFAAVRMIGKDVASSAVAISSGVVVLVGSTSACLVATGGTGSGACGVLGEVAFDVTVGAVELALPDPDEVIYTGAPSMVELGGTVWNPSAQEAHPWEQRLAARSSCTSDDQCNSRACGRETAASGTGLTCSPHANGVTTYAGYDYWMYMPSGSTCWSDYMCASETCSGNMGGFKKGTCD